MSFAPQAPCIFNTTGFALTTFGNATVAAPAAAVATAAFFRKVRRDTPWVSCVLNSSLIVSLLC